MALLKFILFSSFVFYANAQNSDACGNASFSGNYGTISSPGYPELYPNNIDCEYVITVAPTKILLITFLDIDIEPHSDCTYDYVELHENENLIGRYCGNFLQPLFTLNSSSVRIVFHTDGDTVGMGFQLSWLAGDRCNYDEINCASDGSCILQNRVCNEVNDCPNGTDEDRCFETTCGESIMRNRTSGFLISPNYPNNYPSSINCMTTIIAPPGQAIILNVISVDIEAHRSCDFDKLEIYNGGDLVETLCGTKLPRPIASSSNVTIDFKSDGYGSDRGFYIQWNFATRCLATEFTCFDGDCIPVNQVCNGTQQCGNGEDELDCFEGGCDSNLTDASGNITSPDYPDFYPNNVSCNWTIQAPQGDRISITINVNIESGRSGDCVYDSLSLYDNGFLLFGGILCGNTTYSYTSFSSVLSAVFETDDFINEGGFSLTWQTQTPPSCNPSPCHEFAQCLLAQEGVRCTCLPGYTGNGFNICSEINPCNSNPCHAFANCSNNNGSAECTCAPLYTGDGYNCSAIPLDPCLSNDCHQFANCIPTQSTYFCQCREGYTGDGRMSCAAIDTTGSCTEQYRQALEEWRRSKQIYESEFQKYLDGKNEPCYDNGD